MSIQSLKIPTALNLNLLFTQDPETKEYYVFLHGCPKVLKYQDQPIGTILEHIFVHEFSSINKFISYEKFITKYNIFSLEPTYKHHVDTIKHEFKDYEESKYFTNDSCTFIQIPIIKLYKDIQIINKQLDAYNKYSYPHFKSLLMFIVSCIASLYVYIKDHELYKLYKKDNKKIQQIHNKIELHDTIEDIYKNDPNKLFEPFSYIISLVLTNLLMDIKITEDSPHLKEVLYLYRINLIKQTMMINLTSSFIGMMFYSLFHISDCEHDTIELLYLHQWFCKFKLKIQLWWFKFKSIFYSDKILIQYTKNWFYQLKKRYYPFKTFSALLSHINVSEPLNKFRFNYNKDNVIKKNTTHAKNKFINRIKFKKNISRAIDEFGTNYCDWLYEIYYAIQQIRQQPNVLMNVITLLKDNHNQYEHIVQQLNTIEQDYRQMLKKNLTLVKPTQLH
jgi:hypothetical protein